MSKPDPGTQDAIVHGCTCPPTNRQPAPMKQYPDSDNRYDWMCVRKDCPMHGWK